MTQRITLAQAQLQMAQAAPELHDLRESYRKMYIALNIKDIDALLPPEQEVPPRDPISDQQSAMTGNPIKAYPFQNHEAYIQAHSAFMQNPMMQQDPQLQQQMMQMSMSLESRKAKLIAEMTEEFKNEENKIMGEYNGDPIAKLKARELDLRAMDDSAKRDQAQEKIDLDKSKQLMGQQQFDEKLQQNEELAELRADTSLEKTQMGIDAKMVNDMMKQTDVRILKGPKR